MTKRFNWTKITKQNQMRRNGTQEIEAMTDSFLKKHSKTKRLVKSKPKQPIVYEWDPKRST